MRCYAVKDVAGYFGRDATRISATMSRYNGKVEKQPEMRRKLFRLKGLFPMVEFSELIMEMVNKNPLIQLKLCKAGGVPSASLVFARAM
jgi:hypothetical protein